MKKLVGTITLKRSMRFTQYSGFAAWTDYVQCEPQTVPLYCDDYWAFASFNGVLSATSFPLDGFRVLGSPWVAHVQTQKWGGIGDWIDSDIYTIEITSPDFALNIVGHYESGKPMIALQSAKALALATR